MDKFVLNRAFSTQIEPYKTLNIREGDYAKLVQMSQESGYKISEVAALAIRFAFERLEITDDPNK